FRLSSTWLVTIPSIAEEALRAHALAALAPPTPSQMSNASMARLPFPCRVRWAQTSLLYSWRPVTDAATQVHADVSLLLIVVLLPSGRVTLCSTRCNAGLRDQRTQRVQEVSPVCIRQVEMRIFQPIHEDRSVSLLYLVVDLLIYTTSRHAHKQEKVG